MVEAPITFATPADAFRGAVDMVGGQVAMARLIGVTQPTVFRWLRARKALPADHVLVVEKATGISRHELQPTIYPRAESNADERAALDGPPSLFDRFGGVPAMAEALDLDVATVIRWQQDRFIAAEHQRDVLRTALRLGHEVTAEDVMFPFPEDRGAV